MVVLLGAGQAIQRTKTRGPDQSSRSQAEIGLVWNRKSERKERKSRVQISAARSLAGRIQQVAAAGRGVLRLRCGSLVSPRAAQEAGFEHWRSGF